MTGESSHTRMHSATPTPRVELRPLEDDDLDVLVAMIREPSVARWWGPPRDDAALRADLHSPDEDAFAILADGAVAGWLGSWEENEPHFRYAGLDISLREAFQGRGIGPEALRLGARRHFANGHHRVTIDPAAANERAIGCYEKLGFRRVGVLRRYTLAPDRTWEDGMLMDLLEGELN
jgi:aminoglycoside 6'-N-acetyltransferase